MKRHIPIILLLLIPAALLLSQEKSSKEYSDAINREENVLEKLRKEIQENEREMKDLLKRESDILSEIYRLEKKIDLTDKLISELESDIAGRKKELSGLEERIGVVGEELDEKREVFHRRLRGLYKRRNIHPLEIVLGSSSFSSALRRIYFMALVAGEDKRQIEEYTNLTMELSGARQEWGDKLEEITTRMDEVKKEKASLVRAEKKKEGLHASVKDKKNERKKAIEKLQQETKRLSSLIDNLEKKRLVAVDRERRGLYNLDKAIGLLRWPVEGEVITKFGSEYNPDLGTKIESNGIDISANKGTLVHAVAPGKVEFSDWWQSYGKMVIVSHSQGYYTLYAHLSRVLINVGKDIKEGEVIGEVGDTGSLTGPYLHFEVRKGREAVNPLKYLQKR
jgi:septal ring factor EnvC (AmiA/AmiB activator)